MRLYPQNSWPSDEFLLVSKQCNLVVIDYSTPHSQLFMSAVCFMAIVKRYWSESGGHHWELATTPYSCHGVFTDRCIFSLNLSRIQIPTGTSVTNCNHNHWLKSTCRNDVNMFTWGRIVLSLQKRAHVDWNWLISREKYQKIDWSVKMPLHWLIIGVAGS